MATGSALSHLNAQTNLSNGRRRMPRAVAATAQNRSYWASVEADVHSYLDKSIPIRSPESVFEPMRHLALAAPRTTASALCVAACELVSGDRGPALAAAAAVHLMHAAAHIHEHLPLTDRPRPRPTIEHKYGPNIELLTGDGIVPFGVELVAGSMDPARGNQDRVLRAIVEVSRASGSQGVVDGQYQELLASSKEDGHYDVAGACRKREGELHACGAACGAILGGGSEEEIERLRNFGAYVGTARGLLMKKKHDGPEIEELKALALKEMESFRGNAIADELIEGLGLGLVLDQPLIVFKA